VVAAARVAPHGPQWVLGVHCDADPPNVRMNNSLSAILRRRSYQGVSYPELKHLGLSLAQLLMTHDTAIQDTEQLPRRMAH